MRGILRSLPGLYGDFLPDFFRNPIAPETGATCSNCAMWPGLGTSSSRVFSRVTKCCTHYPHVPNYLLGALLSDPSPDLENGRERILKTLRGRLSAWPWGIRRPGKITLLLRTAPDSFGRSKTLLCPYFEKRKGSCTLRPYWNSVCSTWFCKHDAGWEGWAFWRALRNYMEHAESALAQHALLKMNWNADAILPPPNLPPLLGAEEIDGTSPPPEAYEKVWGKWAGREEEVYREAYAVVKETTPSGFERITGVTQQVLLKQLKERYKALALPSLPERLRRNPKLVVEQSEGGAYILTGYSPLDPLEVSERVYHMLDFFDGRRSNKDAFSLIRGHLGARPTQDLMIDLYRFRILEEV